MAKKDFMSELAKEVHAKKQGDLAETEPTVHHQPVEDAVLDSVDTIKSESGTSSTEIRNENPDSFREEKRVLIEKPKRKIKKSLLITSISLGIIAISLFIYFVFVPKIIMPDFVNGTEYDHTLTGVSNWARQYKMSSSAIAQSDPEYSDTVAKGMILRQSVPAGKRIKPDTPITFTLSDGPDPSIRVSLPDIQSMTKDELDAWAKENHLLKYKATTQYSDTIADGKVIRYEVKGDESSFTRGTALNIFISKGKAPATQVTVESFVKKPFTEANAWASQKKVIAEKVEVNSATVEAGTVISQSIAAGQTMDQGATITFTVSKGKGLVIPNLVGFSAEQLEAWKANKDVSSVVTIISRKVFNEAPAGNVIAQSIKPGTTVDSGTVLEVTESLYLPILQTSTTEWIGKNYLELKAWVDKQNSQGARIQAGEYGDFAKRQYSPDVPKDGIIEIACSFGTSSAGNGCERPLTLDARIAYRVSLGPDPSLPTPTPSPTPTPTPTPTPR